MNPIKYMINSTESSIKQSPKENVSFIMATEYKLVIDDPEIAWEFIYKNAAQHAGLGILIRI